jgi:hypothetical protein
MIHHDKDAKVLDPHSSFVVHKSSESKRRQTLETGPAAGYLG